MQVKHIAFAGAVGLALSVQSALRPMLQRNGGWLAGRRRLPLQRAGASAEDVPAFHSGSTFTHPRHQAFASCRPQQSGLQDDTWEDYSDLPDEVQQAGGMGITTGLMANRAQTD